MADLTSVGVTSGVPSSGTGTVGTINYLTQVGAPISNGSTSAPVTVTILSPSSVVTSTMAALAVQVSSLSPPRSVTLTSNPTVIPSSIVSVAVSSAVQMRPSFGAAQVTQASVSVAASSNNTLVTRTTGTIKVYGMMLVPDNPVTMTFFNGSSASILSGAMFLGSLFLPIQPEPYFTTTGTNNFVLNLSSSGQVSGMIYYLDN